MSSSPWIGIRGLCKRPLFRFSWTDLAKESLISLWFLISRLLGADKVSCLCLSENSSDFSAWGWMRGRRGRLCVSVAQTRLPAKTNWVEAFGKRLNSGALECCQRRRCGEMPAWQMTSLSPTHRAPNYCNPWEPARPPSSVPSSSLHIALIETHGKRRKKGKKKKQPRSLTGNKAVAMGTTARVVPGKASHCLHGTTRVCVGADALQRDLCWCYPVQMRFPLSC